MSGMQSAWIRLRRSGGLLMLALLAALLLIQIGGHDESADGATSIENRLRSVLTQIEGAGDVSVLVNEDENGEVVGVCVLTTNADDVAVVFRLQRAVRTTLGIENDRVEILSMEEKAE